MGTAEPAQEGARRWPRAVGVVFALTVIAVPLAATAATQSHHSARTFSLSNDRGRAAQGGGSSHVAKPEAGVARRASLQKPSKLSKPRILHLKKARSVVFDVRKLKSVVIKKERAEDGGPNGDADAADSGAAGPDGVDTGANQADTGKDAAPSGADTRNLSAVAAAAPAPDSSFDGLDFANWGAGHPPDENGDVGPTYYIQTINTSIGIYDKSNGNRVAAFTFNAFMSQGHFGNLCDTNNFGDPVVLYDSYENRWFITDFAFALDGSGNVNPQTVFQCFAVSKTGDPVNGGWNFYSILDPGGLGDYPKFGVWPDGIYMSANMFGYAAGASYQAPHMWALNKQQMYAGAPSPQVVDFTGPSSDFTLLPANSRLQTGAPPTGSPEYFVSTEQFLNALSIYKFHVDWDKVSTSTFTGPTTQLAPNCWPNQTPANASTTANAADVLAIRAMAQAQYTNQGGAESVWVDHTVQRNVSATNTTCNATTGGNATPRWYQANVTGGNIAANVVQGATYDPEGANTFFRYVPSLAVDRAGDMAMDYTKSNSTTAPQIKYAGRLASDPLNTLGQSEQTLINGTGSQSGNCGSSACIRWGDYSGMALDPNGCEFWTTGEYFATTGLNFLTRIGSFHYPNCTTVGNGTLSGTVTDGTNPIAGATVTLGSRTATTDGSGNYSFTVPAGTYPSETADKPGFNTASASTLVVPDGGTLTKNFALSAAAQSGCFTDNTQTGFQRGTPTNCDLVSSPGNVVLAAPDNTAAQNSTVSPTGFGFNSTSWAGQTFTPTVTGQLKRVDVELFCSGCSGTNPDITLSIRATTGSPAVPTGADLASATLAGFNDGGAGGLKTVTFSSPITVTAGTRYAFIFRSVTNRATGVYAYTCSCATTGFTDSNPYANGQRVTSTTSGASWTADTTVGGRDLNFITYINPGFASSGTLVSSLKDANPKPGSTAHWTTLTWSATTPAGTGVKFQVAGSNNQYGPFNFVGPDGTASTFFTTSGASMSQFDGMRYVKYEAILSSSNPSVTPSLSSVQVCFTDTAGTSSTSLAVSPASGTFGGTASLSATLTSGGNPVPNEQVAFTLNGTSVGSAQTNGSGVATIAGASLSGINAGSYPNGVGASFAGDTGFDPSSGSAALTVSPAGQTITIQTHAPGSAVFNAQFTVAATGGGSGNPVIYSNAGGCSNTGATFTMTSGSTDCTVKYDQAGNGNYNAAPQLTETVTAQKAGQTISVTTHAPATAAFNSHFTVAANGGGSGNPVTFSSVGSCSNTGATFTISSGSGNCTVKYDQAGDANYNAATQVTETTTATKADQAITVNTHAPASAVFNTGFTVAATGGGSGNPVTYSSAGGCSNAGDTFTMTSGTTDCTVKYDQAGNANFNAATQVTEATNAQKADQTISVQTHAPASAAFNTQFTVAATAPGGGVSYSSSGSCSNTDATVTITSGSGTCTVKYDQAGNANYNAATQVTETTNAQKADQTISVQTHAPASAAFNTGFTVAATGGGSGNPLTYSSAGGCSNSGATFTMTSGTTACTVKYDQAGDADYNAATQVTETTNAQKAEQTISVSMHAPATAVYATSLTVAASAPAGVVSLSSAGVCMNIGDSFTMTSGTGTCTVHYDQAGDANYNAAPQVTETTTAIKAGQTITVQTHAPGSATNGSQFTVAATAPGGAVSYSSSGGCTNNGATFTMTSSTTACNVMYDQGGNANYSAAPQLAETVVAEAPTKNDQTITVNTHASGTAIYGSQFTVSATAPGGPVSYSSSGSCSNSGATFTMTSALGTCTVKYDQAGSSTYNPAPQVTETVNAAAAFGGFNGPGPKSGLNRPGATVQVKFTFTNAAGQPLPSAMASALAGAGDVEVTLSGPNNSTTQLSSALCSWLAKGGYFQCSLDIPLGLNTGRDYQYKLTALQMVGGGFVVVPPYAGSTAVNPQTIQLSPTKVFALRRAHVQHRAAAHKRSVSHKAKKS
jgi:hypothetical protein